MQSDTETESEPESTNDSINSYTTPCPLPATLLNTRQKDVLLAVEEIKQFDLSTIRQDTRLQEIILAASNSIISFLDEACACSPVTDHITRISTVLPHIVDLDFLSILFDHRQTSYNIAAGKSPLETSSSATIVSWVDVILARLGDLALHVTGSLSPKLHNYTSASLQFRQDEDSVRAATQLPEKWQSLTSAIASNKSSPAAKRLALRILFVVYVIGPQLCRCDPWAHVDSNPRELMDSLLCNVNQDTLSRHPAILSRHYFNDQISFAMVISLYSVSQIAMRKYQPDSEYQSPLRPRSFSLLLNMIGSVMDVNDVSFTPESMIPQQDLEIAQSILLGWGNILPWSWSTWGDQRLANVDNITHLTVAWLYHIDPPSRDENASPKFPKNIEYQSAKLENQIPSHRIILAILHQLTVKLLDTHDSQRLALFSTPLGKILFKSCWLTTQLLADTDVEPETQKQVSEFYRCLLSIFCILGDSEKELRVKDLILEALTLGEPSILCTCLEQIQQDTKVQFNMKIDEGIIRARKNVHSLHDAPLSMCSLLSVKCVLIFFTIVWHSKAKGCILHGTASSFLALVATKLQELGSVSQPISVLYDALLTALAALGNTDINIDEGLIWTFAINSQCSNFIVASALAHRVLATDWGRDILCCAEAWSYLQNVLLLVIGQHLSEDDEAMALLVCPILCYALMKIIRIDLPTTLYGFSSPWTTTMASGLYKLINNYDTPTTPFFINLHRRLKQVGEALLEEITRKLKQESTLDSDVPRVQSKLVFCYPYPYSRLVLVPMIDQSYAEME